MKIQQLLIILTLFPIISCQPTETENDGRLQVVATTGMLYDAVINIAGEKVIAQAIMGPGVDPHLYKATQGDLSKLNQADIIIYNGLYLEGKMGEILKKLSARKSIIAAAEAIPDEQLISSTVFGHSYDPHVWFDVSIWQEAVKEISSKLQAIDAENAAYYKQKTTAYLSTLDSLHGWVKTEIEKIPKKQRVLVTAHDAFGYFGRAYNIEVRGLQGLSTASDFGLKDIADITDLIIERNVKAIFVETSVSEKAINAVLIGCNEKGHEVTIGGYLYSDAMGEFGTPDGTYLGMVKSNVETITNGLKY